MKLSNGVEPTGRSQPVATKSLIARNRSHTRKRAPAGAIYASALAAEPRPRPPLTVQQLGAPRSEGCCFQSERLLYGREPNGVWAEPGKQKTRSCRTQELARSSAQENEWQKKGGVLDWEHRRGMEPEWRAVKAEHKRISCR